MIAVILKWIKISGFKVYIIRKVSKAGFLIADVKPLKSVQLFLENIDVVFGKTQISK